VAVVVTPVYLLLNTMQGRATTPTAWGPVFLLWTIGIATLVIGYALPPKPVQVLINAELIEYVEGRRRLTYHWRDVSQVAMRRMTHFGVAAPAYSLHVRLRPGVPRPPSVRAHNGWFPASHGLNVTPDLPDELHRALTRFAPGRWTPPPR
jgi:hypothetical protein